MLSYWIVLPARFDQNNHAAFLAALGINGLKLETHCFILIIPIIIINPYAAGG